MYGDVEPKPREDPRGALSGPVVSAEYAPPAPASRARPDRILLVAVLVLILVAGAALGVAAAAYVKALSAYDASVASSAAVASLAAQLTFPPSPSKSPTSLSPSSQSPTSQSPTSQSPTSQSPTSQSPSSPSPTSLPTSQSPTSQSPTALPTSQAPTSQSPTTSTPTTPTISTPSPTLNVNSACPNSTWVDHGGFCSYGPLTATAVQYAGGYCSTYLGARTCTIGEYYSMRTMASVQSLCYCNACGSTSTSSGCWTDSFAPSTDGLYVTVGTGWDVAVWDTILPYFCCLNKW